MNRPARVPREHGPAHRNRYTSSWRPVRGTRRHKTPNRTILTDSGIIHEALERNSNDLDAVLALDNLARVLILLAAKEAHQ